YMPKQRGAGVIAGNPDLKPEASISYEIGAVWDNYNGLTLGATYFYTDFTNKLTNENTHLVINPSTGAIRDPGGNCSASALGSGEYCLWEHFTIDGAVFQGLALTAGWDVIPTLSFLGNYTHTQSVLTSGT